MVGGAGVGLDSVILPVSFNWTSLRASLKIRDREPRLATRNRTFRKWR